jgi:hypothetical protein
MPLPKLIFGEDHLDLITMQILSAILPKLKEQGYDVFLDEMPTVLTLESLRKNLNVNAVFYSLDKKKNPNLYDVRQETNLVLNNFLEILIEQKIDWQAIDPMPPIAYHLTEEQYEALQPIRDKEMASIYQNSEFAFGRVGLSHISGIRECLVETLGEENVTQDFRFFHIHSLGEVPTEISEIKDSLPNDLIIIDAVTHSQEAIINKIIEVIELAKEQSNNYSLR